MRISLEDGQRLDAGMQETTEDVVSASRGASEIYRSERVMSATVKVLAGEAPRGRALKQWENQTLTPLHIQLLFDRADGMRNCELAEKYEMTASRVSTILGHPDAEYLMGEILGTAADRIADPIERMKSFAQEMVNVKLEIVRDSDTPRALKNDIASDFLDRAGYGARKKLDVESKHSIVVPAETATRLADALDASRRVASVDYTRFLAPKLLDGTTQAGQPTAMTPQGQQDVPAGGHPEVDNGASPDDHPVAAHPDADWRHEERLAREEFDEPEARRGKRRMRIA